MRLLSQKTLGLTPELSGAADEASYKAESVFRVRLNDGLGAFDETTRTLKSLND